MSLLALLGLCAALAWIFNGLHAEGMKRIRIIRQRERASACYPFRRVRQW